MPQLLTRRSRLLVLPLAVALAACGGKDDPDDVEAFEQPPPSLAPVLALQLSESELTLGPGGDGRTVTVRATGASGPLALGVAQLSPHKLTASFKAVSDAEQSLTLRAPADMPPGPYTLYVKGTAGGATGAAELSVTVGKSALVTVSGTLRNTHGVVLPAAAVRLTGFNSLQVLGGSDAQGRFTLGPVLPPYTAKVTLPSGETHTFVGLTRADPTLRVLTTTGSALTPVSISGTLSGGTGFPNPAGTLTQVVYTSAAGNLGGAGLLGGQGPGYTVYTEQVNETALGGTLDALQWEAINTDTSSVPVTYRGYVRTPVGAPGQTLSGKALALAPVGQSVLSGVVQPTAGMAVTAKGLGIHVNARGGFALAKDTSSATNFSYPVPVHADFQGGYVLSLAAQHAASGGAVLMNRPHLDAAQTVTFALPTPPVLTAPAHNSTGAVSVLQWAPGTLQAPLFVVRYQASGEPSHFVYTGQTAYPVSLAPGKAHGWNLIAYAGFATPDAFAAPELWPAGYPAANGDTRFDAAATPLRNFTTAP